MAYLLFWQETKNKCVTVVSNQIFFTIPAPPTPLLNDNGKCWSRFALFYLVLEKNVRIFWHRVDIYGKYQVIVLVPILVMMATIFMSMKYLIDKLPSFWWFGGFSPSLTIEYFTPPEAHRFLISHHKLHFQSQFLHSIHQQDYFPLFEEVSKDRYYKYDKKYFHFHMKFWCWIRCCRNKNPFEGWVSKFCISKSIDARNY